MMVGTKEELDDDEEEEEEEEEEEAFDALEEALAAFRDRFAEGALVTDEHICVVVRFLFRSSPFRSC